jgi:DNA-binding LytR/AlgR family response regulator
MRCIIIEDQAPAQQLLKKYIQQTDLLELEMAFFDALEAKTYLNDHPVDLIFLDINLPRLSGMDFLKSQQNSPLIILTTAHAEFALESYEFNVVDYLLKPFSFERFSQAIHKITAITSTVHQKEEAKELTTDKYVYIKSSHELLKINSKDIIFIKSDSDYTEVVTATNKYLTSESLKDWLAKLDDNFSQVHKSYIINTSHLLKISQKKIYLSTNRVIPMGRAFTKNFMAQVVKLPHRIDTN